MRLDLQEAADLATFTEEIIIGKLHFVYSNITKTQNVSRIHAFEMVFIRAGSVFKFPSCS